MNDLPPEICKIIRICSNKTFDVSEFRGFDVIPCEWSAAIGSEMVHFSAWVDITFARICLGYGLPHRAVLNEQCSFRNWSVRLNDSVDDGGSIINGDLADIENDVVLLALALT